jgi:hypothetical protein
MYTSVGADCCARLAVQVMPAAHACLPACTCAVSSVLLDFHQNRKPDPRWQATMGCGTTAWHRLKVTDGGDALQPCSFAYCRETVVSRQPSS